MLNLKENISLTHHTPCNTMTPKTFSSPLAKHFQPTSEVLTETEN